MTIHLIGVSLNRLFLLCKSKIILRNEDLEPNMINLSLLDDLSICLYLRLCMIFHCLYLLQQLVHYN